MNILILYGTESGTTAYVAEAMRAHLTKKGHNPDVQDAAKAPLDLKLDTYDLILLGSPTYADGQLASSMAVYLTQFKPDLSQKKIAVFSLGDRTFSHYCASAEILAGWVEDMGGKLHTSPLKIDGYPYDTSDILAWLDQVIAGL